MATSAPSKFIALMLARTTLSKRLTPVTPCVPVCKQTQVSRIGAITNYLLTSARMLPLGCVCIWVASSLGTTTQAGRFNIENADNGENVVRIKNTSTSFNNDMLQLICSRDGATSEYNAMTVFTTTPTSRCYSPGW